MPSSWSRARPARLRGHGDRGPYRSPTSAKTRWGGLRGARGSLRQEKIKGGEPPRKRGAVFKGPGNGEGRLEEIFRAPTPRRRKTPSPAALRRGHEVFAAEGERSRQGKGAFDEMEKKTVRSMMKSMKTRIDGRGFDESAPSSAGGICLDPWFRPFHEGETQALATTTLGTPATNSGGDIAGERASRSCSSTPSHPLSVGG
jgi:hypothetical protein